MKIAGARVENKSLAPGLAIFMLRGAPTAHEVLPVKSNHCASKLPTPTYHEQFAEFDTI
jgi:hypothetical protein